ncbi:MAG: 1-deoxy-D-xylulose-5-phosphate reductoisomerase [Planctomyces sp.]|nr:1-deoxy-D-xylulose-5-phosphate reductoisomerase [Planctomyces sp.]
MKHIAILGSTGSIGTSCCEVVAAHGSTMRIVALTTHGRWEDLAAQCWRFRPGLAVISDGDRRRDVAAGAFPPETEVRFGPDAVVEAASLPEAEVVVSGIVGAAGLRGAWAALEAGKRLAVANKETLVVAGPLVMELARRTGAELIPVDSEHSAIFQALAAGRRQDVRRIILTASGGPFRTWPAERLRSATPADALSHPTWQMGPKITVDSATMMNKALEVIEARWLFDLDASQIDVVVHPQSVVHSLVEFVDGSVLAQLSPPDMKLPIQYAITYPERRTGISPRLDFQTAFALDFSPPDPERFPALSLGFEVARRGGGSGAVLNAANEVAVARFLGGSLSFPDIARACREVLDCHQFNPAPTLAELIQLDAWAREEMQRWKPSS